MDYILDAFSSTCFILGTNVWLNKGNHWPRWRWPWLNVKISFDEGHSSRSNSKKMGKTKLSVISWMQFTHGLHTWYKGKTQVTLTLTGILNNSIKSVITAFCDSLGLSLLVLSFSEDFVGITMVDSRKIFTMESVMIVQIHLIIAQLDDSQHLYLWLTVLIDWV